MNRIPRPPLSVLLEWIISKNCNEGARHDAAMDLADFDEPEALQALLQVGQDPADDLILFDVVGESLGEIWTRNDNFDPIGYAKLVPIAKREAYDVIKRLRPDWIEKYQLQRK